MSVQRWQETLISAQGDGGNLTASAAATSILPQQAKLTFPANYFNDLGKILRIRAAGRLGNIATTPGTLTLDIRLGGNLILNGGAMQLSTTVHTTLPWEMEAILTQRATGSSANFMGIMRVFSQCLSISGADPITGHSFLLAPNVTPVVGANFDATIALQLDLFATFSLNNANAIQLHQYFVEALN